MPVRKTDQEKLQEINKLFLDLKSYLDKHLGPESIEESYEQFKIRRLLEDISWALKP
jgi:hypothetical protein